MVELLWLTVVVVVVVVVPNDFLWFELKKNGYTPNVERMEVRKKIMGPSEFWNICFFPRDLRFQPFVENFRLVFYHLQVYIRVFPKMVVPNNHGFSY